MMHDRPKIFEVTPDPTFVLILLWQAIYAWDEAIEDLYAHVRQSVSFSGVYRWLKASER